MNRFYIFRSALNFEYIISQKFVFNKSVINQIIGHIQRKYYL